MEHNDLEHEHEPFQLTKGNSNKAQHYVDLLVSSKSLISGENDAIANTANIASLVYHELNLQEPKNRINWAGFYFMRKNQLVLGPFQGKPACIRIKVGKGVCGTAVSKQSTMRIEDVHKFPGHISCDSASNSELVIPLIKNIDGEQVVLGVFDLDSSIHSGFDEADQKNLEAIVEQLITLKLLTY